MECDVLVAGGGSAGLAAAVAAARMGARTVLVERHGILGGMAPAALVHSICGLYRLPTGDAPPVPANEGFAMEFATRLQAAGGATGPVRMGRVDVLMQRPVAFAQLADEIVRECPLLTVRFHTEIIAARDTATASEPGRPRLEEPGRPRPEAGDALTVICRGRTEGIRARTFVDATGDGTLAALRGTACEMEIPARLQRPAYIFSLGGVEALAAEGDARLRLAQRIANAVKARTLSRAALGSHFRPSAEPGEVFVTIDLPGGPDFDPLDSTCLTRLEMEGRETASQLTGFLRVDSPGFSKSYIAALPGRVGVRESRRVTGRYRIEAEDIETGGEFPDSVAFAAWPMELRETAQGPRWRFPRGNRPCGIPLRALRARDDDALFMAGRCISCSHEAQASLRVIGTCLATGEAAGLAAALKVFNGECDASGVMAARAQLAK